MTSEHKWGAARFTVTNTCGAIETITVSGRDRWALECVIAAGQKGCTPIATLALPEGIEPVISAPEWQKEAWP